MENQNATEYGDKKKTLLEKTKDYAVEKGNEFVLHLKETDWLDTINRSLDYPKGLLLGAGESATFGYTNFIEDHISIYDKETYLLGKLSGNYLVGSILSEGGKAGGISLTLSGTGSIVGVPVFSYSEAVQLYSVGAIASNSVLMVNSGGDEKKTDKKNSSKEIKYTYNGIKEFPNYPEGFTEKKGITTKNKIKDKNVLSELKKVENTEWTKVYKDGYDKNGNKISIHYFQSKSGKVFNVKTKNGWSNIKK